MQIKNRARALPTCILDGALFPINPMVYCPPLTAPIFRLSIYNNLKFGAAYLYIDGNAADVIFSEMPLHIDTQKFNSYSERTTLFPKGTIFSIDNEEDFNAGSVILVGYTYYWEV